MSNPIGITTAPTNPSPLWLGPAIEVHGTRIMDRAAVFSEYNERLYPVGTELIISGDLWVRENETTWIHRTAHGRLFDYSDTDAMTLLGILHPEAVQSRGRLLGWLTTTPEQRATATQMPMARSFREWDPSLRTAKVTARRIALGVPTWFLKKWTGLPIEFIDAYEVGIIGLTESVAEEILEVLEEHQDPALWAPEAGPQEEEERFFELEPIEAGYVTAINAEIIGQRLDLAAVAILADIDPDELQAITTHESRLYVDEIARLGAALGVTPAELSRRAQIYANEAI